MNYNSNAGGRTPLGRKIKRVSDVNAMGYTPYESNLSQQTQFNHIPASVDNVTQYPPQSDYVNSPYVNQGMDPSVINNPYNPNPFTPNLNAPQMTPLAPFNQPIVQDFALQYGQQLANVGTTMLQKEVNKYVPVGKLKYYFAVDKKYVLSKLLLLFFPFTHANWSIKYEQDAPVQPRFEINAPDLYIPMMAYITYILSSGLLLGTQHRFTFEQIVILASSALAWCALEICIYLGSLYIAMIDTTLRTLDLLAFSGYKFVGMILSTTISLIVGKTGYYLCLVYCNFALAFFLVRSLKTQVLPASSQQDAGYYGDGSTQSGNKRRLYFLLFVAIMQPILSWWLSYHLIGDSVLKTS